ncbi:MJ0042-type zinc finger domain-containing protein, partial [Arthrospira platensis SPKY2]
MYTRCHACRTVFHITAAELRAAEGTVVCGACGITFNALDTLSETRPADLSPAPAPVMSAVLDEV